MEDEARVADLEARLAALERRQGVFNEPPLNASLGRRIEAVGERLADLELLQLQRQVAELLDRFVAPDV
jgi:hypothetical protein